MGLGGVVLRARRVVGNGAVENRLGVDVPEGVGERALHLEQADVGPEVLGEAERLVGRLVHGWGWSGDRHHLLNGLCRGLLGPWWFDGLGSPRGTLLRIARPDLLANLTNRKQQPFRPVIARRR